MAETTRTCPFCGLAFKTTWDAKIYCRKKCRQDAHNAINNAAKRVIHRPRPCEVCGLTFTPGRADCLTCSEPCRCRLNNRRRAGQELRTKSVDCRWCATIFMPVRSDQIFCSSLCGSRHAAEVLRLANGPLYCHDCGDELGKKKADRKYCANCISARRRIASSSRRAAIRNLFVEPVDLRLIAERDKWCCQLCGKRVRKTCLWPDPLSPSLDHVIPIFHGGEHSRANTQLAHLICNQRKHVTTRNPQQLALIG